MLFPGDIFGKICEFLRLRDIYNVRLVCKNAYNGSKQEVVWINKLNKKYSQSYQFKPKEQTSEDFYRKLRYYFHLHIVSFDEEYPDEDNIASIIYKNRIIKSLENKDTSVFKYLMISMDGHIYYKICVKAYSNIADDLCDYDSALENMQFVILEMNIKPTYFGLKTAIYENNLELTKYLVSLGLQDHSGEALDYAICQGYLEMVKYLVSIGYLITPNNLRTAKDSKNILMIEYIRSLNPKWDD